jgi:hypothetical protein
MAILQTRLPYRPWSDPGLSRLPGLMPVPEGEWLIRDEAFAGQMAERDRLIGAERDRVLAEAPGPAAAELLAAVLAALAGDPGYRVGATEVVRPDGVAVALGGAPLPILARLCQEDFLIHERQGAEHVLTGGLLLFPASWTLRQKLGRPLTSIHAPIPRYDTDIARRVQRLFDLLQPGRPVWRANWLIYRDADLFQPRREGETKPAAPEGTGYLRSERQSLVKLPQSGAVVFAIHTYVLPLAAVPDVPGAAPA